MCGIAGYVGNNAPNIEYLTYITSRNTTRGTDACGLFVDGNIHYGLNKESDFDDYISNNVFPNPSENFTILTHTRKASTGMSKSEWTAHPHGIYVDDSSDSNNFTYKLVGVHNGTLTGWRELAKQYDLDVTYYNTDSRVLFKIIADHGPEEILLKYKGNATIMYTDPREPNSLWIFKGKHETYGESERPLYYWYDEKSDGYYFGSMKLPLCAIAKDDRDSVAFFPTNTLTKFVGSEVVEEIEIDRETEHRSSFVRNYNSYDYGQYDHSFNRYPRKKAGGVERTVSVSTPQLNQLFKVADRMVDLLSVS